MPEPNETTESESSATSSKVPEGLVEVRAVNFVNEQPADMPASELVERAKDLGIELDLQQVYRFREKQRARVAKAAQTKELNPMSSKIEEASPTEPTESAAEAPVAKGRRGRKPGGEGTKAGFVRSLSVEVPAKEAVEQAKERGLEITEGYVYAVRAKMKGKGQAAGGKPGRGTRQAEPTKQATPAGRGKRFKQGPPAAEERTKRRRTISVEEKHFAQLVVSIGLARAEELLAQVKSKLSEIF